MPERVEKLRTLAQELAAELDASTTSDPQSRESLAAIVGDLRAALDRVDVEPIESDTLAARFRAAEAEFQVSHPTISGLVLRMIDALGQLGI